MRPAPPPSPPPPSTLIPLLLLAPLLLAAPSAGARRASRTAPWQAAPPPPDDAIYFVLVDRFANGDPANDGDVDPDDPQAWHGGDLRGVLDEIDEIEALGVRTVWLSPVFACRDDRFFAWGAFHGYWVEDYTRIEPRFGTVDDLRALSDALHARGMRLLLDVVFNHVAMDAPLLAQHPDWFHDTCDIEDWDDPRQLTDCRVHGLPDLAQENEEVYQYLLQTSLRWIDAVHPDGFRIDAVRHMPRSFLKRFAADVRAHAGPGFQLLGEDFEGDALRLSASFRDGGFTSMFDFPLHYAMLDVYCADRPVGRIAATLSADREYDDASALVPFLDNHDRPRLATACGGSRDRIQQALTFLLTARGTPSLTYGTESGLEGEGEPDNRADMRFEPRNPTREHIALLLALRRTHPALQRGTTRIVALDGELLVLARIAADEAALIALNRGDAPLQWTIPEALIDATDTVVDGLTGHTWGGYQLSLPPRSTQVFLLTPDDAGGFAGLLDGGADGDRAATRRVRVVVPADALARTAPDGDGDAAADGDDDTASGAGDGAAEPAVGTLGLVGNGPALGNWDPGHALRGFAPAGNGPDGDDVALELDALVGAVLEFKLVRLAADGTVTWQPGENHYLFVAAGDGVLEVREKEKGDVFD